MSGLTRPQQVALRHVALLAQETAHPRFGQSTALGTVVLTVNARVARQRIGSHGRDGVGYG